MSYDPNDKNDLRNLIRKCPHCKEIWIKEEACDNNTTCGNRGCGTSWFDNA